MTQLKSTIATLRDSLELNNSRCETRIQNLKQTAGEETRQLHETIVALRDKLQDQRG
jgi:hypothetical protein